MAFANNLDETIMLPIHQDLIEMGRGKVDVIECHFHFPMIFCDDVPCLFDFQGTSIRLPNDPLTVKRIILEIRLCVQRLFNGS
jgi:hypothetical protein